MPVVLALVAESLNDALGAATRAHKPVFDRLGLEFREINFSRPAVSEQLNQSIKDGDIAFAYSGMGFAGSLRTVTQGGQDLNLWEAIEVPFISLMGDSPAYFFDRHIALTNWHAALYFFPDHHAVRKRYPLVPKISGVIPPVPFDATDAKLIDLKVKEQGRLLFLKNGNDPEKLVRAWRDGLPESTFLLLAQLASDLAAGLESDAGTDIDSVVSDAFRRKGWDIEGNLRLRLLFLAQLDDYLRRIKSTMLGRVLSEFPVDIQGYNWEHLDLSRSRARYRSGGDYLESGSQIRAALGVIDMSPNTRLAPHDRTLRAMGLHTLFITNRQTWFEERFADWKMFSFDFTEDSIRAKVADVLARPKQYVELGRAVAARFNHDHSPDDFGQFLVDTASHVRASNAKKPGSLPDYFVWPPTAAG